MQCHRGNCDARLSRGGDTVRIWQQADKAAGSAFTSLGQPLALPGDFTPDGDAYVKDLWVEGISHHSTQQAVRFKLEYEEAGIDPLEDTVALTVIGITGVTWSGHGNSISDGDDLDEDANWPAGLAPGSARVFPDSRIENGVVGAARDRVAVRVTLSVAPPMQLKVFLRSFDVDDPTSDAAPLDNEGDGEDNRGLVPAKAGRFVVVEGDLGRVVFPANVTPATQAVDLQVTMQPGDNFRVVANGDKDFLGRLHNNDVELHNPPGTNEDKQRIIDPAVAGSWSEKDVRTAGQYCTRTLTVWRFLHVERDSMGPPPTGEADAERNFTNGQVTGLSGAGGLVTEVTVDQDLNDQSPMPNGRFENGRITIGSADSGVGGLTSNTASSVALAQGLSLPFTIAGLDDTTQPPTWVDGPSGSVAGLNGQTFTLATAGVLSPQHIGLDFTVAGLPPMIIAGVNDQDKTLTVAQVLLPFRLVDDDSQTMPSLPDTTYLATAFAPAYVHALADPPDGGGNPNNNEDTVPFRRNSYDSGLPGAAQSDANRRDSFWVAYILGAFQPSLLSNRGDNDPNSEMGLGAACTEIWQTHFWPTAAVFNEDLRDERAEGRVFFDGQIVAHEIGHEFGLDDKGTTRFPVSPDWDLMGPGVHRQDARFVPMDLDFIRRGPASPGRRLSQ